MQEKLNLVTNYFAEDWAIDKAMQLLYDYEKMEAPQADSVLEDAASGCDLTSPSTQHASKARKINDK